MLFNCEIVPLWNTYRLPTVTANHHGFISYQGDPGMVQLLLIRHYSARGQSSTIIDYSKKETPP